jgi:hypothetical protein
MSQHHPFLSFQGIPVGVVLTFMSYKESQKSEQLFVNKQS